MSNAMSTDTAQPSAGSKAPAHGWVFRAPQLDDAKHIHALIQACPPLDVNSLYVYLLLAHHHSSTCVLAQQPEGPLQGFVSAYVPPQSPDVLFVWQVAVHDSARGAGLGKKMLGSLLSRPGLEAIRHIETTVGPAMRLHAACLLRWRVSWVLKSPSLPCSRSITLVISRTKKSVCCALGR